MELAISLIAIGGLFILSNQNKEKKYEESFTQMHRNYLPNTDKPVKNYPVVDRKELENTLNKYAGKKNTADNYYNPGNYETLQMTDDETTSNFNNMAGESMTVGELTHNNMVPYFGSSVTQSTTGTNEGILDKYTGSGSQRQKKQSQAPLFKPQKNMNWTHGMPSTSDFIEDRMKSNLSLKMNNTKPFQSIQVGPGLNKKDGINGSGGFNSGMEGRDSWRPKTIDELRTSNNPKVTYEGQMLGAYKPNKPGIIGRIEKNRPDTFFINSEDRWLTTTGIEKAQKARGTISLKPENRAFQTREYFGQSAPDANGTYSTPTIQRSEKPQFKSLNLGVATDVNGWDVKNKDMREIQQEGYKPLANSRNLTKQQKELGAVGRGFRAMVAPILDVLRPSRKQNVIGNMRPMGNVSGANSMSNGVIWNPGDKLKTTIKEQTIKNEYITQGGSKFDAGYTTNKHTPFGQQRDTTTNSYIGNNSASITNARVYNAEYNARLNPNKQELSKVDRIRQGNQKIFSGTQNVCNLKNRTTNAAPIQPNFTKRTANSSNVGEMSGRNLREKVVQCGRNTGDILNAFNDNPYSKSLNSVA
tara:strand:+ start:912 stop:2666 length:1755 start_codon:yes stop_codon:yes gene_type:complete